MNRRHLTHAVAAVFALLLASPTAAGAGEWAFHAGVFDVARDQRPIELGIEYRFEPLKPIKPFRQWGMDLVPTLGAAGTEDGNFWIVAGMRFDWKVAERWHLVPVVGASYYEEGNGKDLGGPIEFKTGLELSYRFAGGQRFGVLFYHLSHANIYADNPGSNSLVLTWSPGR